MDGVLETAIKAVQLYAETHQRPPHVTQSQAAKMLRLSRPTICAMVKRGEIKLNAANMIPITEIDRVLQARKAA